jgi:hypothetical protein
MTKRSPFVRVFTLMWASLQLAAPAMSSIADGLLAIDNASRPTTHVEATTTESCPVVHAPDCGVCRYLTTAGTNDSSSPAFGWQRRDPLAPTSAVLTDPGCAARALPHGRAPPSA